MSRVYDSALDISSLSGDSRFFNSENPVRADDGAMRWHVARHDRIRAHGGTAAYAHRAEHLRARADEHVILDYRHRAALLPGPDTVLPAYGHLVHQRHPAADSHAALDDDARRHGHQDRRANVAIDPATGKPADQRAQR